MLAAENSDFGVDGTGNVDGSYRLIRLKDRWTVWSENAQNMARWPCCIDCCLAAVDALQTLSSTFIYTVEIYCPSGCSFETFAGPNNAECFFTSKTNLTARRHFVSKLS